MINTDNFNKVSIAVLFIKNRDIQVDVNEFRYWQLVIINANMWEKFAKLFNQILTATNVDWQSMIFKSLFIRQHMREATREKAIGNSGVGNFISCHTNP